MFVLGINGGLWEGGKVFNSLDEITALLIEEVGGNTLTMGDEDEEYEVPMAEAVDRLCMAGNIGEVEPVYNDDLLETCRYPADLAIFKLDMPKG